MTRSIDKKDLFRERDSSRFPLFTNMAGWELQNSAEQTKFLHRGLANPGERLSDKWWNEHVKLTVGENVNLGGAQGKKGYGKKKIRKVQRKRGAGWHGNHPEQKPFKVERESIRYAESFA